MFRSYTEKVYRPDLKSHTPRTPALQWFSCDICDKDDDLDSHWRSETDVELHRKEAHFKLISNLRKTYEDRFCTVCMTLHDSNAALISHIKSRHLFSSPQARRVEREIFICGYCYNIFFNKDVLESHIQYLHTYTLAERRTKSFDCPKCKKICQLKSFWFHMQYHNIPSISICDICLDHCSNVKDLMIHMKEHPMYYKCEICNYETSREGLFESHLDRHRERTHQQSMLKAKMYSKEAIIHPKQQSMIMKYNIHHAIKGMSLPSVMHICVLCREITKDKYEMLEHIARDHMSIPEPYKKPSLWCHCGAEFQNRVLLRHHVFKLKGTHGEASENPNPPKIQPLRLIETSIAMETEHSETNEQIEIDEQNETDEQIESIVQIVIGEENETNERTGDEQIETNEQIKTDDKIENNGQNGIRWQLESGVEIEIQHGDSRASGETVILSTSEAPVETESTVQMDTEKNSEELVYIYATVTDGNLVTTERNSEKIIGL